MIIPLQSLSDLAAKLAVFRSKSTDLINFDGRDQGNYLGYGWDKHVAMMTQADPTGMSIALVLAEMIEATITGSHVNLARLLREEGYLERLGEITRLESQLLMQIDGPRQQLLDRLNASLETISPMFGRPTTREVAICLRDAIYSMQQGLKLRWLTYTEQSMAKHVPLSPKVIAFENLAVFVDALRSHLPFGAYLARIGQRHTAIGIKQPGNTAYLSSLNIENGSLRENRATNHHMAERLDLDTPVERYPDWQALEETLRNGNCPSVSSDGMQAKELCGLNVLPRDRLLWLAMVVEMATQRMAAVSPQEIELVETMARALAAPAGEARAVAIIEPNWTMTPLSIASTMEQLALAKWERQFLQGAVEGMAEGNFFTTDYEAYYGISLTSRTLAPWPRKDSFESDRMLESHAKLRAAAPDLAGTRQEVEAARQALFARNLLAWIFAWGNDQFEKAWDEHKEWFKAALANNLQSALQCECVVWRQPDFRAVNCPHLYTQNPKRKTYSPLCSISRKKPVTVVAHFVPANSGDLVAMLGLRGEDELPIFLRGWSRLQSWTTSDRFNRGAVRDIPYGATERWSFGPDECRTSSRRLVEASVCLNDESVAGIRARGNSSHEKAACCGQAPSI